MTDHALIAIILGVILLLFGRSIFWLFIGAVGFISGMEAGTQWFAGQPQSTLIIAALLLGFIGIVTAIFLQKLAVAMAGFVAGVYLTLSLTHSGGAHAGPVPWLLSLIGGVIGLVMMLALFRWTLIVLSSVVGAHLIAQSVHLPARFAGLPFFALAIVGIVIQSGTRRHASREE